MKTKHTPGPWEILPESRKHWKTEFEHGIFITPHNRLPTFAYIVNVFNYPGQTQANAKLIAAAPDLLEACQAVVDDWKHIIKRVPKYVRLARSAVKKAGAK